MTDGTGPDRGETWPQVLQWNGERYGDRHPAMRVKHYGIWHPFTWKDYYLEVRHLALGMQVLGFQRGDKVLIIGENAPQWYAAELAAQSNGGASVGVHSDLTPAETQSIARHCEARYAVVEGQEQVDKLLGILDELPRLERIIYWNYKGLAHYADPILLGYRQVVQDGRDYDQAHPGRFEQQVQSGRADDVCALVYTAGTTDRTPKAAVHTFRTMRASVQLALQLDPWVPQDNLVPYLPPTWITGQWFGIGCHLLSACTLNFAEAPETLPRDIRETSPSIVIYGARVWERQAALIQARLESADLLQRTARRLCLPLGEKMAELRSRQQPAGLFRKLGYALANRFFFKPIKKSLGLAGSRICYSTGAILSPEACRFYRALQLPLKSLYGSTEGGLLAGPRDDDYRLATVGPVHPEAEVRLTDRGELVYRHPGIFIGYYQDPDKTAAVLKDGWFYSGDHVRITENGHLVPVDRLQDRIELAGGEILAPQGLEARLRFSPYIQEVWVSAATDRPAVAAVVIIDYERVSRWAGKRRVPYTALADLSQRPEVVALIRQEIQRINADLPAGSRIRKFTHLHREFDPNEGELTRTGALCRSRLATKYRDLLEALHGGRDELTLEEAVQSRDGRIATVQTHLHIHPVEGTAP